MGNENWAPPSAWAANALNYGAIGHTLQETGDQEITFCEGTQAGYGGILADSTLSEWQGLCTTLLT